MCSHVTPSRYYACSRCGDKCVGEYAIPMGTVATPTITGVPEDGAVCAPVCYKCYAKWRSSPVVHKTESVDGVTTLLVD